VFKRGIADIRTRNHVLAYTTFSDSTKNKQKKTFFNLLSSGSIVFSKISRIYNNNKKNERNDALLFL
jgi:ribosomal protein S1